MILASSKMYGNNELHIPKAISDKMSLDKDTVFEWRIENDEIIIKPRRKIELDDVIGMVTEDDEITDDWDIDKGVYLNE